MGNIAVAITCLCLLAPSGEGGGGPPAERTRLLREIDDDLAESAATTGVPRLSEAVRAALLAVPRERFVPPELRRRAWENRALPIGHGQTISQPLIVALMTELLAVGPADTVLEIGTGSGYQAAVLGRVLTRGRVYSIEIVPALAERSRQLLKDLGAGNVEVITGDGYAGLPRAAPFDGIIVTAVGRAVPPALAAQLAPGARLVMPVGDPDGEQWLTVFTREQDGALSSRPVLPVRFVPLTGGGS
jgi:protein-L-isoaspartate(D-aspartate) O-methyltransferase